MKAPDKIYVAFQWHPDTKETEMFASYDKTTHPREIEYIRKDSLVKWANEKKAELLNEELTDVAAGINMGMDMLIYKLEHQ